MNYLITISRVLNERGLNQVVKTQYHFQFVTVGSNLGNFSFSFCACSLKASVLYSAVDYFGKL